MIFASINALEGPLKYPAAIQSALDWITGHDVAHMDAGIYEIQGKDLFINIQDITTQPVEKCNPERHDSYLDIQYIVSGVERMGYVPYTGEETILAALPERDCTLYTEMNGESFVDVAPGGYCIFFSNDIHRPGCAVGAPAKVRKAVAKIRQSLL